MKRYYNKSTCRAGVIDKVMRLGVALDFRYRVMLDDGEVCKMAAKPIEQERLIFLNQNSSLLDGVKQGEAIIPAPFNEWFKVSEACWLIERYDIGEDDIRYAVVDASSFTDNFYEDDDPELIQMTAFEKPTLRKFPKMVR